MRRLVAFQIAVIIGVVLGGAAAHADVVALWRFDEGSGMFAFNEASGTDANWDNLGDAYIYGTAGWADDAVRGSVLSFDKTNYADAGMLPEITADTDFTISFWANSSETAVSTVMLGNRYTGNDADPSWIKFTPSQFEYVPHYVTAGVSYNINYVDVPTGEWVHHAVVKSGTTFTYYRNGYAQGANTSSATMPSIPFGFGHGFNGTEPWAGSLDDVVIYNTALTNGGIRAAMNGDISTAEDVPAITVPDYDFTLYDDFESGSLDTDKWDVYRKGLEKEGGSFPYTAEVDAGQLVLGVSDTGIDYWNGVTAEAAMTFNTSELGVFSLRRPSFDYNTTIVSPYTNAAARSSIWLYADQDHYFVFSENRGETGWSYNYCDGTQIVDGVVTKIGPYSGGGTSLGYPPADGSDRDLVISLEPEDGGSLRVTMYIDEFMVGTQVLSNWPADMDYRFLLSAMGRCQYDDATSYFDDVAFLAGTGIPDPVDAIDGDLNGDGAVNSDDLDIIRANWGQTTDGGAPAGDPSLDGVVGSDDLDIVRANWGNTASAAVPEPFSLIPLFLGALAVLASRKERT